MAANNAKDFAHVLTRPRSRTIIVAVFDLVGFTRMKKMDDMYEAVQFFERQVDHVCKGKYHWGELDKSHDPSKQNDLLILPTGDGAILCFDHTHRDDRILADVVSIYKGVTSKHKIYVGLSKGDVQIVRDLNDKVNVIGWPVNTAQRACSAAGPNEILVDSLFAETYSRTYDKMYDNFVFNKKTFKRTIKGKDYRFSKIMLS